MKKSLILILLISVSFVYAQELDVSDKVILNTITPDETAKFNLFIKNEGTYETFKVSVLSPNWIGELGNYLLSVSTNEIEYTEVRLIPKKDVNIGSNSVVLLISGITNETRSVQHTLNVNVENFGNVVSVKVNVPDEISIKTETPITLELENKGVRDLKDIKINLLSSGLDESFSMDLDYNEKVEQDVFVTFDKKTKPGEHILKVEVLENENIISSVSKKINIIHSFDVNNKEVSESGFLYGVFKIVKTNEGNSVSKESITLEISSIKKLFTKLYPEPSLVEGNKYTWEFELNPGKNYIINVVSDYRPFVLGVLLFGLVVFTFVVVSRRKVFVKKKVEVLKEDNKLKITLFIKNNKSFDLKSIKIIDKLPGLMYISENFGTMKPDKVVKEEKNVKLEWDISILESGAERIFSYEAVSDVHVVGKLVLPKAVVKYKNTKNESKVDKSNSIVVTLNKSKDL